MGRVEHHLVRLHDDAAARQRAVLLRLLDTRLPHRREARAPRLHEAHLAHAAAAREALPRADADRRATLRRLELGDLVLTVILSIMSTPLLLKTPGYVIKKALL